MGTIGGIVVKMQQFCHNKSMARERNPVGKRPPKNPYEAQCFELLKADGWEITKQGWPDFACFRNGEFITVEVKGKRSHRLKKKQYEVMLALSQRGVKCYRWTPDTGFQRVTPTMDHV